MDWLGKGDLMHAVIDCAECSGMGMDPSNTDALCPQCRGYGRVPYAVRGPLERAAFADWPDLYRTRQQAVDSIDPFYR